MGTKIKDAQLLESVTGAERIPVSDGSGNPKAVTTEVLKNFVGASGGGGIPIVDSEDKLETLELPQGGLASVAYDTMSAVSFRELYQPTVADVDQTSGMLTNPDALSSVSKLEFTVPAGIQSGEPDTGFYLVPRTFSLTNQTMIVFGLYVNTDGNVQGLMGITVTSEGYEHLSLFGYDDNGVPSVDQTSIDKLNALLETDDWCYFGYPDGGFTLTEAQFDTLDKFVKAVSGAKIAELYIKRGDKHESFAKKKVAEDNTTKISVLETGLTYLRQKTGYPILVKRSTTTISLSPNKYYEIHMKTKDEITIDFSQASMAEDINEYIFELHCNGYGVTLPNDIKWANGSVPYFKEGSIVVVSIVRNLAVFAEFV